MNNAGGEHVSQLESTLQSEHELFQGKPMLVGEPLLNASREYARRPQIVKRPGRVQQKQFSNGNLFDGLKLLGSNPQKHALGFGISKGSDHAYIVYR